MSPRLLANVGPGRRPWPAVLTVSSTSVPVNQPRTGAAAELDRKPVQK